MIESCQSYSDRSFTDRRASGASEIKYGISNSLFNRGASAGSKFWFRKKGVALHSWNLCYGISNSLFNGEVSTGSKSDSKKESCFIQLEFMICSFLFYLSCAAAKLVFSTAAAACLFPRGRPGYTSPVAATAWLFLCIEFLNRREKSVYVFPFRHGRNIASGGNHKIFVSGAFLKQC